MSGPAARPLILGNWKMHATAERATALLRDLLPRLPRRADRDIAVAPPFTALSAAAGAIAGSPLALAAQDVFWEEEGAYTGEIAPTMLIALGVRHVIVGHSERRRHLGETDAMVARKTAAALRAGLRPVVCVGETGEERDAGRAGDVVRAQVRAALRDAPRGGDLSLAYEPVWAIGTGRAATPADVAAMHALVRAVLGDLLGPAAAGVRVLYGGSVTPDNSDALLSTAGVGGVLVGGASLDPAAFARIAGGA